MTNKDIISVLYLSLPTENLVDIDEFKHIHNDSFKNLECDIKIKYNIVELANNRITLKDISVETLAICIMYKINIFKVDTTQYDDIDKLLLHNVSESVCIHPPNKRWNCDGELFCEECNSWLKKSIQ